jgi:hypothetical protein
LMTVAQVLGMPVTFTALGAFPDSECIALTCSHLINGSAFPSVQPDEWDFQETQEVSSRKVTCCLVSYSIKLINRLVYKCLSLKEI